MAEAAQPVRLGPSAHPRPSPGRGWSSPSSPAPALSVMASALARGSSCRDEGPVSGVSLPSAKAPSPKGQRQRRHSRWPPGFPQIVPSRGHESPGGARARGCGRVGVQPGPP